MRNILYITVFLTALTSHVQSQTSIDSIAVFQNKVNQQELRIDALAQKIDYLTQILQNQKSKLDYQAGNIRDLKELNLRQGEELDSIQSITQTNAINVKATTDDLGAKIQEAQKNANAGLMKLDKNLNQNKLYWIIATLATLLLGGLIYWLLNRRILSNKTDVETQIKNTKKSLEEEGVKLDNKLIEVLETQLKISQIKAPVPSTSNVKAEIDHSLVLKMADEVIRIQRNISQMDSGTRGLRQLSASLKRIQDNFISNGYELVDMLGKEFNEGMKAIPNFIQSEDLETGKQIITRIIKPQVNYNNEMIQSAQIEVSVGE